MKGDAPTRRRWPELLTLLGILAVAAGVRFWNLDLNGYGNEYYAATIRGMTSSWHNWFYAAFDPGGYLSVDKPPVSLWVQTAFVGVFGYSGWSLHAAQAFQGVLTVFAVYAFVRWVGGPGPALLAAAAQAVMPIAVAVDRSNLPDTCLTLVLTVAAGVLIRAAATGSSGKLWLALALVGVGFNVKMLAAFVVLPPFYFAYLIGSTRTFVQRIIDLIIGTVVVFAVGLSWTMIVEMTPPEHRPYVGDTTDNSMVSLVLGWNGVERLTGPRNKLGGPAKGGFNKGDKAKMMAKGGPPRMPGPGGRRGTPDGVGPAGIDRLVNAPIGDQFLWLMPLGVVGLVAPFIRERPRLPMTVSQTAAAVWGGWFVFYFALLSYAGFIHNYYVVVLGPPLAALVGVGAWELGRMAVRGGTAALAVVAGLALAAAWQWWLARDFADWRTGLTATAAGGAIVSAVLLISQRWAGRIGPAFGGLAVAAGVTGLFAGPVAWSVTTPMNRGNFAFPSAGPVANRTAFPPPGGGRAADPALIEFLRANRDGARFLAVTRTTHDAAPLIITTGEPVIALGGFLGSDPTTTPEKLAAMVKAGEVRFAWFGMGGPGGMGPPPGMLPPMLAGAVAVLPPPPMGGRENVAVSWVQRHGKPVQADRWRSTTGEPRRGIAGQLLELRPPEE